VLPLPNKLPHSGHLPTEARRSYPHPAHNPIRRARLPRITPHPQTAGTTPNTPTTTHIGNATIP
jgi:hypothetical protein